MGLDDRLLLDELVHVHRRFFFCRLRDGRRRRISFTSHSNLAEDVVLRRKEGRISKLQ
jgi:hypothetical protein